MEPYCSENGITIYHGDCREVLPFLPQADLVLTDPPYPNMDGRVSTFTQTSINFLANLSCRQLVFWHSKGEFPLSFNAVHIWSKQTGCQSEYERIFERNSTNGHWRVFNAYLINSTVAAQFTGDVFTGHYSQKPIKLITKLLLMAPTANLILDPFMGSGTTLRAAKDLGRRAIGIEIEERYCEIAANRLRQEVLSFEAVA